YNFCFDSLSLSPSNKTVLERWTQSETPTSIFQSEIDRLGVDASDYQGFRVMAIDDNGIYLSEDEVKHNYDSLAGFVVEGVVDNNEYAYLTEEPIRGKAEKIAT